MGDTAGPLGRGGPIPIGIFRQVQRPTYDDQARAQVTHAQAQVEGTAVDRLTKLINAGDTWTVG